MLGVQHKRQTQTVIYARSFKPMHQSSLRLSQSRSDEHSHRALTRRHDVKVHCAGHTTVRAIHPISFDYGAFACCAGADPPPISAPSPLFSEQPCTASLLHLHQAHTDHRLSLRPLVPREIISLNILPTSILHTTFIFPQQV